MRVHNVTTPFGRRPMTLALMQGHLAEAEIKPGKSVDKWKLFRDVSESGRLLGISDRSLAVLNALLSFYPEQNLSEGEGLVVFPSNNQLTIRANGITGTTLRRHLAALIDAGLITRKDSPNGKRYAHKNAAGVIANAFGFSLAPLLARCEELAVMAQRVVADRRELKLTRDQLSICRRDIRKLIATAREERVTGDWDTLETHFETLLSIIPRNPTVGDLLPLINKMEELRARITNLLEMQLKSEKMATSDGQNGCHIQNSNTESFIESEQPSEIQKAVREQSHKQHQQSPVKAFPLEMVLKACPQINDYGPAGGITNWRDLMTAAIVVRSMLNVSAMAYQEACEVMRPENAATVMACILERADSIHSAGGYLRDLTKKAKQGEFSLAPPLMALLRTRTSELKHAQ